MRNWICHCLRRECLIIAAVNGTMSRKTEEAEIGFRWQNKGKWKVYVYKGTDWKQERKKWRGSVTWPALGQSILVLVKLVN